MGYGHVASRGVVFGRWGWASVFFGSGFCMMLRRYNATTFSAEIALYNAISAVVSKVTQT